MKKIFIVIFAGIVFSIWAFDNELPHTNLFYTMISDKNIPVEKRLNMIDSLLVEDPSNFDLLVKKWDIAMLNGYYYRGHEALSKLYVEYYDSLDVRWKCYLLSGFSVALYYVGLSERSAAIALKLLQLEKPDSLKRFDLDVYLSFLELNNNDIFGHNTQFDKDLQNFCDIYEDLNDKGLLNKEWQQTYLVTKKKSQMLQLLWDKNYDSLFRMSDDLLKLAKDHNDTTVALLARVKVYNGMDRPDVSEGLLKKLLVSDKIHYNTSFVVEAYMELLNKQGRYQECVNLYDTQAHKVEVSTSPMHMSSLLKEKAHALGKLGRFEEADSLYRRIIGLQDEYNSKTGNLIMEDLANYNMEEVVAAKYSAQRSIAQLKTAIILISILFLLSLIFTCWLWGQRRNVKILQKQAHQVLDREAERRVQKERELTSMSLQMLNLHELVGRMEEVLWDNRSEDSDRLRSLQSLVREATGSDNSWEAFKQYFEESHHGFIERLTKAHPNLTENDVKICAFMVLNFSTKDIATLTHRSVRTIETAKYRLHKKLDLPPEISTLEYLRSRFIVVP